MMEQKNVSYYRIQRGPDSNIKHVCNLSSTVKKLFLGN